MKRIARWLLKAAFKLCVLGVLLVLGALVADAFRSRSFPELEKWHQEPIDGEFRAGLLEHANLAKKRITYAEYKALEDDLFEKVPAYNISGENKGHSPILRYEKDSIFNPLNFPQNYNRSYELIPDGEIRGGVVMFHGLTDSPYSLRTISDLFHQNGYYVLNLRLPGHGTVPAGLLWVHWKDWLAAAKIGIEHVKDKIGDKAPFYLCGYSNGGALALKYTATVLLENEGIMPNGLFLFSPAVGITAFARASNWHVIFSWMEFFKKNRWLSIIPEIDPYKYNSFPKNASAQTFALSRSVQRDLDQLRQEGRIGEFPPIVTFQSAVDSTVLGEAIVRKLYDKLEDNGSMLIVADVNHASNLDGLFRKNPRPVLQELEDSPELPYHLMIVTNAEDDSSSVVARTKKPFSTEVHEEPLGLKWPRGVYSLAHVALTFPPDDPVYGRAEFAAEKGQFRLGDLSLRGENNVLRLSPGYMLRIRFNPFHSIMLEGIAEAITTKGFGTK